MALLATSCRHALSSNQEALIAAEEWGEAYFNDDFVEAGQYATPESERWLRFAASNATEEDLKLLNANKATVEADEQVTEANDTMRVVTLHVDNYLESSALGSPAKQAKGGLFVVNVVKSNDRWLVKMEGLPQSGKQSRD